MDCRSISLTALAVVLLLLVVLAPDALLIIFAGILFAVFLDSGGDWIARKTGLPHGAGIGVFCAAILLILAAFGVGFAPAVSDQFAELWRQIPKAANDVIGRIEQYAWGRYVIDHAKPSGMLSGKGGRAAASAVWSTFGALGNFVIILFIGLFCAVAPRVYTGGLVCLAAPSLRSRMREILRATGDTLRKWLLAKIIAMSVVGVLTGLGLWAVGVPLALPLGLIAGLLAFIPNIGPVIAALPGVLLGFSAGSTTALLALGVYVGVQSLESYLITPLLQQETVSLPPGLILSMQVVLGVLFGILGLALATPLTAVMMTIIREAYVHDYLERESPEDGPGDG